MQNFFKINCRSSWASPYCDLGNVCSLFAQLIGFTAILPQIHQIWSFQSVGALHVLWPTMLVTAALPSAFYIFSTETRVLFKFTAIYYPVVYLIFLLEFWFFTQKSAQRKLSFAAMCIIVWACLLTIELSVSLPDGPERLEWMTIVLYSIKVLPQIMLNLYLRTTFGQSSISVLLYGIVSSLKYMSVYLLQVKLEYRVMEYLSVVLAYVNAIQVIWYPRPELKKPRPIRYGAIIDSQDYSIHFEDRNAVVQAVANEVVEHPAEVDLASRLSSSKETSSGSSSFGKSQTISVMGYYKRLTEKSWWQLFMLLYLFIGLIIFTVILGLSANTIWVLCGPLAVFGLLFVAALYRDYKEGSLDCYYLSEIHYKIMGDSS